MFIRCWGSRGSIPVSGRQYLKYGGDTTCLEIRSAQDEILVIDAGTGIRRLGNRLLEEKRLKYHFLFTHAHWDHLMGFPFFKPLFEQRSHLIMHRCPYDNDFVKTILSTIMAPPNFPVRFSDVIATVEYPKACPMTFQIGAISVEPISISHPNGGSGYKFTENGKNFVFLTDNELGHVHPGGLAYGDYRDWCQDADLLIHDAEYTPEEYRSTFQWGHSRYTDTYRLAREAGVKRLGLFHLNQDRCDQAVDDLVQRCKQLYPGRGHAPDVFAVAADMTFRL